MNDDNQQQAQNSPMADLMSQIQQQAAPVPQTVVVPEASVPQPAVAASNQDGAILSQDSDPLTGIKRDALEQLTPLVSELDQSPEEKFHTLMMMIQASDNKDLIQPAYEAAKEISDDKERAQALLDVVNEINYFTQSSQSS